VLDQPCGGLREHHRARGRHRFHPLRHADLLTDCGVTEWARTDFTGDHLTGVESHSQLQIHTVAVFDLGGQTSCFLLDVQRRQTAANSVVLQRHRRAEHSHDAVAGELCNRAAVTLHNGGAAVGQVGHDLAQPLRPDGRGDVHRVDHVGEQNSDLLVLRMGFAVLDWCTTAMTKPGVL
jgi:hypothetical protein